MPEKFICVNTSRDPNTSAYQIYKFDKQINKDLYNYLRYDDEGIIIYKTEKACQDKCDKLNFTRDITNVNV